MNPYQPLRNVDVGSHVVSTHGSRGGKTPHQQPNSFVCARLCEDVLCVSCDIRIITDLLDAKSKRSKTLNSGYLGSRNDEERSEMRYVM